MSKRDRGDSGGRNELARQYAESQSYNQRINTRNNMNSNNNPVRNIESRSEGSNPNGNIVRKRANALRKVSSSSCSRIRKRLRTDGASLLSVGCSLLYRITIQPNDRCGVCRIGACETPRIQHGVYGRSVSCVVTINPLLRITFTTHTHTFRHAECACLCNSGF